MTTIIYINGALKFVSRPLMAASVASLLMAGCTSLGPEDISDSAGMTVGVGTPVLAAAETPPVGTVARDSADDPAIWVDPSDRTRGVIVGTDKQAGLFVYGLDGRLIQSLPGGRPNNVDVRDGFPTPSRPRVLVAATDRASMAVELLLLDPATLKLERWGRIPLDLTEPYGFCLARRGEVFLAISNSTDGQIRQHRIWAASDGSPRWQEERRFAVPSQPEGCVADDARGRLYIGEEAKGIWRFDLNAAPSPGRIVAPAPSPALTPDVEGLALLQDDAGTWLIASSQGDSSFAVWKADGEELAFRGKFSAVEGGGIDAVTGTDGVDAVGGVAGPYSEGLVVVQDDSDDGSGKGRQNFKLLSWSFIRTALRL